LEWLLSNVQLLREFSGGYSAALLGWASMAYLMAQLAGNLRPHFDRFCLPMIGV
jgi:hypothetical protein